MVSPAPVTPRQPSRSRSRAPLFLILAICLAPLVFALLAYYVPALGLRPQEASNYGTLINPQRPMPDAAALPLATLDGKPFDLNSLQGKWLLVSADEGACPEACVKKLFVLRNSHASQGKNVERLARVWFVTDDAPVPGQILEAYVGTNMLRADPEKLAAYLAPNASPAQREAALKAPMWIIDPLGNLMLEFPADADPISVRNDISKLIRNSRIG
ncbi:Cytochrome oxidase Cu insertion factor, SCO1/SenC/PrrC family [Pollutimonas bauzanensis]|uniref:Cytochrome oxidase Cu insertion factor, SCO1/SenC/PrrC family n=1 Tax=Pollutimonas bauzanensis TaxID=658167 RepID=A0A1M5Y3H6_9BURK|nr:Cytochrome oxidase Cu insertion factor, SCO1/SenC/PrrC family [Pollutimonas bauzanensis]